ncbi:unnamed protein product [Meloidogyne enterolobii]|uniref:Uncharacterized protein n=1 Tax=Meloidogyne enterolobii TaxID=390850 RepID=A0ACB1AYT2_MELEN
MIGMVDRCGISISKFCSADYELRNRLTQLGAGPLTSYPFALLILHYPLSNQQWQQKRIERKSQKE